jgi:hypothetical protein
MKNVQLRPNPHHHQREPIAETVAGQDGSLSVSVANCEFMGLRMSIRFECAVYCTFACFPEQYPDCTAVEYKFAKMHQSCNTAIFNSDLMTVQVQVAVDPWVRLSVSSYAISALYMCKFWFRLHRFVFFGPKHNYHFICLVFYSGSLMSSTLTLSSTAALCSNCKCQPIGTDLKCGFDDWCQRCDDSLHLTRNYSDLCDRRRFPQPPVNPVVNNSGVCPCGFFAIRNRPLGAPAKEPMPVHLLVTVPITVNTHITICLICEQLFKHHRNALEHLRRHHKHYHEHH